MKRYVVFPSSPEKQTEEASAYTEAMRGHVAQECECNTRSVRIVPTNNVGVQAQQDKYSVSYDVEV